MRLDKRIIIGRKFLDCFDTDTAMQFINEKCYFGEDITDFEDISKLPCSMLYSVDNSSAPYDYYKDGILHSTGFILPCRWVKEEENKYRPYTLPEFVNEYSLGDEIVLRRKEGNHDIRHILFTEYIEGDTDVCFNGVWHALDSLFNEYELYTGKGWKPFGVIGVEVEE